MNKIEKKNMEIYIRDFKEEKQKEILRLLGIETPEEGNYDVMPLDVIEK